MKTAAISDKLQLPPAATPIQPAQELFQPQEWADLLNAFEDAPGSDPAKPDTGELGLVDDELWERLSSTRWLRDKTEDLHNGSTAADRASD